MEYCLTIILNTHLQLNQFKRLLSSDMIVPNYFNATTTAAAGVDEASEQSGAGIKRRMKLTRISAFDLIW